MLITMRKRGKKIEDGQYWPAPWQRPSVGRNENYFRCVGAIS
jgi:hypothetical protein